MIDFYSDKLCKWFTYSHLPTHLQETSKQFHDLAKWIFDNIESSAERTVALRKILEAKDCAVRAEIEGNDN